MINLHCWELLLERDIPAQIGFFCLQLVTFAVTLECYGRTPALPSNAQSHITQGILENRAATQASRLENKTNIQDFRILRFKNNIPDNLIW